MDTSKNTQQEIYFRAQQLNDIFKLRLHCPLMHIIVAYNHILHLYTGIEGKDGQ